jgi:hypothetical protein
MRPRLFFDTHVAANFDAWGADPVNIARAQTAALKADAMADRVFNYLHPIRPLAVGKAPSAGAYRRYLADLEPDFQIVWDAARNRLPLSVGALPGHARESDSADIATLAPEVVLVELRSGEKRALRAATGKVVKMWDAILREQRL